MGRYVDNNLSPKETIVEEAKLSIWPFVVPVALGALSYGVVYLASNALCGGGLVMLAFLYWAGRNIIPFFTTEMALTDQRVIGKSGLFSTASLDIRLTKIESVAANQSFLGRIFNFGTIAISGAANAQAFRGISNPLEFRKIINAQIQEREG